MFRLTKAGTGTETAWGIPRSPEEFVKAALVAGHPCENEFALPQALQHAIDVNAKSDSSDLAKNRALFFRKWPARSKELEPAEAQLKATMPSHIASILAPKKLLLWREILVDLGYPDLSVFDEVVQGFSLTGNTPVTAIFPPTFKPAKRSCSDVASWAPELRSHLADVMRVCCFRGLVATRVCLGCLLVAWRGGCWVCFGWQGAVRVDVFGLLRHGVGLAAGGLCGVEFRGLGFRGLGLRVLGFGCRVN